MPEEPKQVALAEVVRNCQAARAALGETASAKEVGDFWRTQDALHGKRPDYLLWRQLRGADRFQSKPGVAETLVQRGLSSASPQVRWAVVALLPALPEAAREEPLLTAVRRVLGAGELVPAPLTGRLVRWLAESWLGGDDMPAKARLEALEALICQADPKWKVGRGFELSFLETERWLPIEKAVVLGWVGRAIVRCAREDGRAWPWQISAWQLRRSLREEGAGPKAAEVEMLLDAGCMARKGGDSVAAMRWTALAVALLPNRVPVRLERRCRVAAWRLAEAAVAVPAAVAVRLDEVPFSGDPPDSEPGRAAAELFADEWDGSRADLMQEVEQEGDWQVLRQAGVVLNHPLAALAWIGKKAVAHAVKKQHGLLEAASRLALRHGCLVSAGKMLAVWPGQASAVLEFAQTLRQSLRQLPLLREATVWGDLLTSLRAAWGRLEAGSISDEDSLFLLHETLVNQLETVRRCLPERLGDLVSDSDRTALALALEADPRLMAALEHQRTLELWEIAALLRGREELASGLWVSVVGLGEPSAGRYSVMVQGAAGRECWQGRARNDHAEGGAEFVELIAAVAAAAARCGGEVTMLLLAVDEALPKMDWQERLGQAGLAVEVRPVPSWEAAFRVLREWHPDQPFPLP